MTIDPSLAAYIETLRNKPGQTNLKFIEELNAYMHNDPRYHDLLASVKRWLLPNSNGIHPALVFGSSDQFVIAEKYSITTMRWLVVINFPIQFTDMDERTRKREYRRFGLAFEALFGDGGDSFDFQDFIDELDSPNYNNAFLGNIAVYSRLSDEDWGHLEENAPTDFIEEQLQDIEKYWYNMWKGIIVPT